MGVYNRFARRGTVRRSRLSSCFKPGAFPVADCTGCGVTLHYAFGATVPAVPLCEHCEGVKMLTDQGATVPDWASRLFVREGSVQAFCIGEHGPIAPVDTLDNQGRCAYCRLPGVPVAGIEGRKVQAGVMFVRSGNGFYAVRLTADGRVPVRILDQNRGWLPEGETVPVTCTGPAWGTGYQVEDMGTGADVWWMQNWDSSG
jgi:hypothetical protein